MKVHIVNVRGLGDNENDMSVLGVYSSAEKASKAITAHITMRLEDDDELLSPEDDFAVEEHEVM